jgi:ubiquinone/menaquinone biosynthesis C-methylase UbiE
MDDVDAVRRFYDSSPATEWDRLELPLCRIEPASTLHLITKYFPPRGHVCDIGSGPGRYAIPLLESGYAVTLVDLSPAALRFAARQLQQRGLQACAYLAADARDLGPMGSASYDAALCLGPLIHLLEADDRRQALQELRRVLKPGGVAVLGFLNSWGLMRTGLADFSHRLRDAGFLRSMLHGQAFRAGELANFTACYWSTPPEALAEVTTAGFEVLSYACAEGFVGGMRPTVEDLARSDPAAYASVVQVAAETCELPQFRDGGDHLLIVGQVPRR